MNTDSRKFAQEVVVAVNQIEDIDTRKQVVARLSRINTTRDGSENATAAARCAVYRLCKNLYIPSLERASKMQRRILSKVRLNSNDGNFFAFVS